MSPETELVEETASVEAILMDWELLLLEDLLLGHLVLVLIPNQV